MAGDTPPCLFIPNFEGQIMITELTYLRNPQRLQLEARVLSASRDLATGVTSVYTDMSPAYVQGGGQPSDAGTLAFGGHLTPILRLALVNGALAHEIKSDADPAPGDTVTIAVDATMRHYHSRLHTAGELVCLAMQQIAP